jgi:hypothetical protein
MNLFRFVRRTRMALRGRADPAEDLSFNQKPTSGINLANFMAGPALAFTLEPSREVAPNTLDLQIVERAVKILSTEDAWNRVDNRQCPANAKKWSIYCALEKAEFEVTGGFHHRRPAAEVVREIVDRRTANRNYHHRLMDYNNDPTTHLQDIQSLFQEAEAKIMKPQ